NRLPVFRSGYAPNAARLFPLEAGAALVEEGVHALAEILAHIGLEDEVLPLLPRQRAADTAHRLLGGFERERRVRRNEPCRLVGAALPRLDVGPHLVEPA